MTDRQIYLVEEPRFRCDFCNHEFKRIPPLQIQLEYENAVDKITALEAENKRIWDENKTIALLYNNQLRKLREEVKYCKSCFKANPCGNAIKEQDRDELLRRYHKALEKAHEDGPHAFYCHALKGPLDEGWVDEKDCNCWKKELAKALEAQDADK